ncbi:MAG TPA: helix-turn-helix transcriptional regulator [Thermoanaerobaculia bacterium]|jgi:transcriptional regulator with XRE-family HTH domain|nr:helix-turn-helix transcriptional regulator [Thermoanaerobaculia bacterium]
MIGEKIRHARQVQQLSLAQVAAKAKISAATLSRIETEKQNVELSLFLNLARILHVSANELLGEAAEAGAEGDPLVRQIASLDSTERTRFWRDLSTARRQNRPQSMRNVNQQIDELLAQVDFLREEIVAVRSRLKRR